MILTIIIFLLVLSVLVFVHELGHFWTARKLGVKAEEFGFGFPPRLAGIYKNKEGKWKCVKGGKDVKDALDTVYSINWIPLGGFVKIKGQDGECKDDHDSFANHPIWQRFLILFAGVGMNFILAGFLFSIGFMIGFPQSSDNLNPKAQISEQKIQIMQVMPDSPADSAGLQRGDIIIDINEKKFSNEQELKDFVNIRAGEELNYNIKRLNTEMTVKIIPEIREETGVGGIGVSMFSSVLVKYPWHIAIWEGIKITIFLTWAITIAIFDLFKNLITGHGLGADIAGPVGIAALTGQVARMGFIYLLQFSAMLSINLAILNFLPFPALDGGRVLFLIIEKIKGAPVKQELESICHYIGFTLLMLLVLVVTFKDIFKYKNHFKILLEKIVG
ncbi:MAG: RIP metalloprotease RseP [Patescibacteria group bacterium]|nr:RIP metalloprotease RseP [Patescibacteria group bacterium]MBU1350071.1 RIP metalloprotease RseP [Patescibacteria group bacterium]MBU1421397.1 RIP metalloprotease RseP [Patescibacteria group bacterium]MBU1987258.1 RIP metalloprotease RseP [Patescibacteria group bacterium]MBU2416187.1 RIP metalloprotease RseP [Patescibacteria group bacterium]